MQYHLTTPVTREDLAPLKAGDTVLLSGVGLVLAVALLLVSSLLTPNTTQSLQYSDVLDLFRNEKVALLEARRHYCWYLKGVKYANYYKDQINHMETLEDLYRITAGIKRDLSD